jgi:hypothetical protein
VVTQKKTIAEGTVLVVGTLGKFLVLKDILCRGIIWFLQESIKTADVEFAILRDREYAEPTV